MLVLWRIYNSLVYPHTCNNSVTRPTWIIDFVLQLWSLMVYLSSINSSAMSTSDWVVILCRCRPTVPEKTLKLSSSDVVSKTPSNTTSIPIPLKLSMFSDLSFIIQTANSITNLLILGTLVGGYWCFLRIWTSLFASWASVIPAFSNTMLDSCLVMYLKTFAANPTITSCILFSSDIIALSICRNEKW